MKVTQELTQPADLKSKGRCLLGESVETLISRYLQKFSVEGNTIL